MKNIFKRVVPNPDYRPTCHDCANCDEYGCWAPDCKHNQKYIFENQLGKMPNRFVPHKISVKPENVEEVMKEYV